MWWSDLREEVVCLTEMLEIGSSQLLIIKLRFVLFGGLYAKHSGLQVVIWTRDTLTCH